MKLTRTGDHPHHVGHEGSHVMLPMVVLSLMAIGVYYGLRRFDISELGRDALFDVVMVFVALTQARIHCKGDFGCHRG